MDDIDERKRGFIESMIDGALRRERRFVADIEWVQQEIPISSIHDLVVGYIIGMFETVALVCAMFPDVLENQVDWDGVPKEAPLIAAIIKRRLPEIIERIERELGR